MKRTKVQKVLWLTIVLFISACSQPQPLAPIQKEVIEKPKEKVEVKALEKDSLPTLPISKIHKQSKKINLITLSSKLVIEEKKENWVPLQVEDEIEWNAKELLGKRYVWGATGPNTYDCSGFTQKIYRDLGIKLPRVSRDQAKQGKLLKFNELKKGDLVFFHTNRRRPKRVTHVGIYLGNNNFIHASSGAKKIIICNFKKDGFYKKTFSWGRRVITPKQHIATIEEPINTDKKSL